MKRFKKFSLCPILFLFLTAFLVGLGGPSPVQAGATDVLLGAASTQNPIDPGAVNADNFSSSFTDNGENQAVPSLTISGNGEAMIGAIWKENEDNSGQWRQMRVIIDSNGDGELVLFDRSLSTHPWNMTSGTWTYPTGYPGSTDDNGNNDGTIDFDSGESFPWDTFQWWWYESDYDRTDFWWTESGKLMNTCWSGRDQEWNMLPNGTYKVQVWVDEDNDGSFEATEAHKTIFIKIETANITGTVTDATGNPIEGAEVEANSHLGWGNARTKADGTFTVSGLKAGGSYHLRMRADGKVTYETRDDIPIPEGSVTASAGTIKMSDAISITGTIKLNIDADAIAGEPVDDAFTAFTNQWGWTQNDLCVWIDAHNTQGPGWANADARFEAGDSSVTFTLNIEPPSQSTTYQLNVRADGYAATPVTVTVTADGGVVENPIVLTKASKLTGSVKLPAAITDWKHIDVQAISAANPDERYWGWGNVDGSQGATDTGNFCIDGIPAGEFNLEVRVMGYTLTTVEDIIIVQGQDYVTDPLVIEKGGTISGTLTIKDDTTSLQQDWRNASEPLDIWIDAWSPSAGWSGTNVRVDRGEDISTSYEIAGLASGTFEIHCWIGEGYELVDGNGNAPVFADTNTTKNIVLKPFEGVVQGTITTAEDVVGFDLNQVVVEVKRPWDWQPPKIATRSNGKIDANGNYSINGLGTGDYVVKAGMYSDISTYDGTSDEDSRPLQADSAVGVVMNRVFVQNNADHPTTQNIEFEQGYSISGKITLSSTDPPWHDFGDGAGGDPDGRKNLNDNPQLSEAISMSHDVAGSPVVAMPMDMMFMGGEDPRMGIVNEKGEYRIDGLAPGAYIIMPPFSSRRSALQGTSMDDKSCFNGEEQTHHWTATTRMVVISDGNVTGKNFELGNGHTITGQITLPEAPTGDDWQWVGHLELETATHQFMGHGKPLFKKDFNDTSRYDFTFNHVANGDYLVRFWTDRYVPGSAKVSVSNAKASANLTIEAGANLVGKLIDADTGEAITSADGIRVACEAYPWVDGSWRETRDDNWSSSYIESDAGLKNSGDTATGGNQRTNTTPGKFHLTALPTGHKYVVFIETFNGKKTGGAKNYVGRVIANIEVPEGTTGDISVGNIELKEGTTIKGRLTDSYGNGIPGVEVFAFPSSSHDGASEAEGISDTNGYYTIYGIDPNIEYYDLIAAERPFMFDDWGKKVEWGEKRKYNIPPRTEDANFTLGRTTATLSGTLEIPASSEFMMPFKGEGESFPAAFIVMQKKGVIYKDVMEGIEGSTLPMPDTATEATYTIDNIEPGKYKIFFMNYGLPTQVFDNVEITTGRNTKDVTWESAGYKVSGSCALSTGGYPSSSDINGVVCMNTEDQSLVFGMLTQEADSTYSAYEVSGLAAGQTYQLAFYKDSGMDDMPDIFPVGATFTVTADIPDNDAVISRNLEPILMVQAVRDTENSNVTNIGIFSTSYLVDGSISVVETLPTLTSTAGELYIRPGANGSLSNVTLSGDKRNISATYTKDADDSTVDLVLAVHYGTDATTKLETISFNANVLAANGDVVNLYTAGQVKLGNGDASQMYIPSGAFETSDKGKASVTIEKTDVEPGALALTSASLKTARNMGNFSRAAVISLPTGVTAAGDQYDFSVSAANSGATATQKAKVTVQVQYDPTTVTDVDQLNIWHMVDGTWTKEETNRTVDTENHVISVEVSSLSPFVAGLGDTETETETETSGSSTTVSAGSGGGGCFIATAAFGSLLEKHVQVLRDFRGACLMPTKIGKGFVKLYYRYSPPIAGYIADHEALRAAVRYALYPFVGMSYLALKAGLDLNKIIVLSLLPAFFAVGMRWRRRTLA